MRKRWPDRCILRANCHGDVGSIGIREKSLIRHVWCLPFQNRGFLFAFVLFTLACRVPIRRLVHIGFEISTGSTIRADKHWIVGRYKQRLDAFEVPRMRTWCDEK